MTLKEAEELFKQLNGEDPYLIWHEAGEKTLHEYHDLKIPFETKRQWVSELAEQHFAAFQSHPERSWLWFANILDLMEYEYCDTERCGVRLLAVLEGMTELDADNKISVIEYMGSRLRSRDSGCKLFCQRTSLGARMNRIMERLMDFTCPPETPEEMGRRRISMEERRQKAVLKYREEYQRWR